MGHTTTITQYWAQGTSSPWWNPGFCGLWTTGFPLLLEHFCIRFWRHDCSSMVITPNCSRDITDSNTTILGTKVKQSDSPKSRIASVWSSLVESESPRAKLFGREFELDLLGLAPAPTPTLKNKINSWTFKTQFSPTIQRLSVNESDWKPNWFSEAKISLFFIIAFVTRRWSWLQKLAGAGADPKRLGAATVVWCLIHSW